MKRLFFALSLAALGSFAAVTTTAGTRLPSFNQGYNTHAVQGYVLQSYPVYKAGQPQKRRVCQDVRVPIYRNGNKADQTGNVVAGAIIGGILGKALTGKDSGAAVGAVVGGVAGSKKATHRIVGYQIQRQCSTVVQDQASRLKYFEARVRLEGRIYRIRTTYQMVQGSYVTMYMPN